MIYTVAYYHPHMRALAMDFASMVEVVSVGKIIKYVKFKGRYRLEYLTGFGFYHVDYIEE
jgi:hypothetical protein